MKSIKLYTLLFAICCSCFTEMVFAVEKTKTVPNGTTIVLGGGIKTRPGRPKMPSRQMITCIYDGDELTFDFVVPEGMCDVVLTESSGATMSYTIDSSELTATVYVGTLSESEVELTTENGNTYSGTFSTFFLIL